MKKPELLASNPNDPSYNGETDQIVKNMIIYIVAWYIPFLFTYGIWVPGGLFMPPILMGCAFGVLYLEFVTEVLEESIYKVGG